MDSAQLRSTSQKIFASGKGILASDGRSESLKKRFEKAGIEYSQNLDKKFRSLFYTSSGIENYISGVILNETTIDWEMPDGVSFVKILEQKGILPGVKVDGGVTDLVNFPSEKVTEGMDHLRERLNNLARLGVKFTKWRAVFLAESGKPSHVCVRSNCDLMARFAGMSQEAGMVPIVEPEILMDGKHSMHETKEATVKILKALFNFLFEYKVITDTVILKVNMAVAGRENPMENPDKVGQKTLEMLHEGASIGLAGIVFLSGGQDPVTATKNLNAVGKIHNGNPWPIGFSFERALEELSLQTWKGRDEDSKKAQDIFLKRAKLNSLARSGKYKDEMENE